MQTGFMEGDCECGTETTSQEIEMGSCVWNKGCPAGQEVGMCTLKGMDHGWAGAKYTGPWLTLQYGGGEQYENAAELMKVHAPHVTDQPIVARMRRIGVEAGKSLGTISGAGDFAWSTRS